MLLCADGGLRAVGMGGVEQLVECSPHLAVVLRESYVELLVDSLVSMAFTVPDTDA